MPCQVAGTLYRVGPGTYKVAGSKYQLSHWFDGFTHLHRFQLVAQPTGTCRVLYNSRRQVDKLVEEARKSGTLEGVTFGQKRDPCASIFQKVKSFFRPAFNTKDPGLVNAGVTVHANVCLVFKREVQDPPSCPKPLRCSCLRYTAVCSDRLDPMRSASAQELRSIGRIAEVPQSDHYDRCQRIQTCNAISTLQNCIPCKAANNYTN